MAATKQGRQQRQAKGVVDRLFLEHPRSLEMSWAAHGSGAFKVGVQLIGAGIAAIIHGVIPGIFGRGAVAVPEPERNRHPRVRSNPANARRRS